MRGREEGRQREEREREEGEAFLALTFVKFCLPLTYFCSIYYILTHLVWMFNAGKECQQTAEWALKCSTLTSLPL